MFILIKSLMNKCNGINLVLTKFPVKDKVFVT